MSELFSEPQHDYLSVRWTVPGLPDDRSEYHSEISADWWDEQTAEERNRLFSDQREQLAASVAQKTGVQVDPAAITYKVYDHRKSVSPVRPDEEPTP